MLGTDLTALLRDRGEAVDGVDRDVIDITDPGATVGAAAGYDVIVNVAAYTAVDRAEEDEAAAFGVNAVGAANLARDAHAAGAQMVQISTDYVFDGAAQVPYPADAPIDPRSAYGRTKAAGEWAVRAECPEHFIVRTAWLYGAHGPCFPKTIARAARERGTLDVVADQVGQPTWTVDLADLVVRLVVAGAPSGTYHGTASGHTSWHGFAGAIVAAAGLDPELVHPTTSADYVRAAARPAYSVLAHDSLLTAGVAPIGPWDERWALAAGTVLG
jgi:dTDP-4-dehydrorhamnose reductase